MPLATLALGAPTCVLRYRSCRWKLPISSWVPQVVCLICLTGDTFVSTLIFLVLWHVPLLYAFPSLSTVPVSLLIMLVLSSERVAL